MTPTSGPLADAVDFYRLDASLKIKPERRSSLGQYMTPAPICRFMASLFSNTTGQTRVLDPGAGVGSLTAAFAERVCMQSSRPATVEFVCYEIDPMLAGYLETTLDTVRRQCKSSGVAADGCCQFGDFILKTRDALEHGLFSPEQEEFTHAILNPPYRKITSKSEHREALRAIGVETSNLYSGFMFAAAQRLRSGGEMVAIVPRSFCNGPYFKHFREQFFSVMSLRHLHIFTERDRAFRDDAVLQETIILHAVKHGQATDVTITTSGGGAFEVNPETGTLGTDDLTSRRATYDSVISSRDPELFVHIATDGIEQSIVSRMAQFQSRLGDLGVDVSTGPVVDFRLKKDLRADLEDGAVPLLYPVHFRGGHCVWPRKQRKPNAVKVTEESRKWLWPNTGCYVVIRRFTAKEERRRLSASVYASDLPGKVIGFENHLNVVHAGREGMPRDLAEGIALYLNSSLADRYFRQFNGHTQVNASDLRSLRYPGRETLMRLGSRYGGHSLQQLDIDRIIDGELGQMTDGLDPLEAQRKIDDALEILTAFAVPEGQRNDRSALVLLALVALEPLGSWTELGRPLMGVTPIMEFIRENYGRKYAPNTRETIRRQTLHQLMEAGIVLYNPDDPARPVNSPKACYQISAEALEAMAAFGTDAWQASLDNWLWQHESLAQKWARERRMRMIPVTVAPGVEIQLSSGGHSELIRDIILLFAPRFTPGATVISFGDPGSKTGYFRKEHLAGLGVTIDRHGKMPDVILNFAQKDWLVLIEAVTSHGPVNAKRHNELRDLFLGAKPDLVYVNGFSEPGYHGKASLGHILGNRGVARRCADPSDSLQWQTVPWTLRTSR